MHTFSCAVQTISLDDGHIIARFEADPDDYAICRLVVFHEGGESTVATFARNGLVTGTQTFPPPGKEATDQPAATDQQSGAAQTAAPKSGSKSK